MKWLLVIAVSWTLIGCGPSTPVRLPLNLSVDLECDASCFEACATLPPLVVDEDESAQHGPLKAAVLAFGRQRPLDAASATECEERRRACVECIQRGRAAGVIQ